MVSVQLDQDPLVYAPDASRQPVFLSWPTGSSGCDLCRFRSLAQEDPRRVYEPAVVPRRRFLRAPDGHRKEPRSGRKLNIAVIP